jgi:hypothetical protein
VKIVTLTNRIPSSVVERFAACVQRDRGADSSKIKKSQVSLVLPVIALCLPAQDAENSKGIASDCGVLRGNASLGIFRSFPCCARYDVGNTLLHLWIKERVVQIARARRCGVMMDDSMTPWRREPCDESAPQLTNNPRLERERISHRPAPSFGGGLALLARSSPHASRLDGQGAERHIECVNEAGRPIFELDRAVELLPKRIHHAGPEAAPGGRLHDRAAAFYPR